MIVSVVLSFVSFAVVAASMVLVVADWPTQV